MLTRHPSGVLRVDVLQCTATPAGVFDRMFPGCTTSCRLRMCCWPSGRLRVCCWRAAHNDGCGYRAATVRESVRDLTPTYSQLKVGAWTHHASATSRARGPTRFTSFTSITETDQRGRVANRGSDPARGVGATSAVRASPRARPRPRPAIRWGSAVGPYGRLPLENSPRD